MKFALLEWCLRSPVEALPAETARSWVSHWQALPFAGASAFELAVRGGFQADRASWAFCSGYQAALRACFPNTEGEGLFAFCLSEQRGQSSRFLQTRWSASAQGIELKGSKSWTALFAHCTAFFIACKKDNAAAEEAELFKVVRVPAGRAGLSFDVRQPGSFMPELPTARMQLAAVQVEQSSLLPGDGWADYAKPFSALEELYVSAALLAYLLREGRLHGWPHDYLQELLAALALLGELATIWIGQPGQQIALAGATAWARKLFTQANALWQRDPEHRAAKRWSRDESIQSLWVRSGERRAAKAWQAQSPA